MTNASIIQRSEAHQIPTYSKLPIAIEHGDGAHVWDAEGNRYLDFYGGHCVALLGHSPSRVIEAVQKQAATLLFYSNVAYSSVRADAAALLAEMAPEGLSQVYFANSGSEANETALKLARKATGGTGIIAMEGGFHGRTLGSLAVTWADKYRAPHAEVLADDHTHFVPFGDADAVADVLTTDGEDIAAVLLEPIQSIAGVRTAAPAYFKQIRALCDAHGTKLIFDEVQTGMGRTGTFSIAEQLGVTPDLITLAKGLGTGVPVSATLVSEEIAATVEAGDQGSTFGGGMLAMAAVQATLKTLREDDLMAHVARLHAKICEAVEPMATAVHGRGGLIGVELDRPVAPVREALREEGVLVGGSANPHVMRLMPPLVTPLEAVDTFASALERAMDVTATTPAG